MDLVYCRADSPMRPPDYRWERARVLRERRARLSPKWDDTWVRRARRFQEVLARCEGNLHDPRLERLDPPVAGACRVRFCVADRLRWEVEARNMADQPAGEIAERTGVPKDVVEAFEAEFFAVRDRLDRLDWIAAFVFGPRLYETITEDDVDLILKRFAYAHGPVVLEALIHIHFGGPAGGPGKGSADIDHGLAALLERAVAALTIPVNATSAPKITQLSTRLHEVAREADEASVADPTRVSPFDLAQFDYRDAVTLILPVPECDQDTARVGNSA